MSFLIILKLYNIKQLNKQIICEFTEMSLVSANVSNRNSLVLTESVKQLIEQIIVQDNVPRNYKYILLNELLEIWVNESHSERSSITAENINILTDCKAYMNTIIQANLPDNEPIIREIYRTISKGTDFIVKVGDQEVVYNKENKFYEALRIYSKRIQRKVNEKYKIISIEFQSFINQIIDEQSPTRLPLTSPPPLTQRIRKLPDRYKPTTNLLRFNRKKIQKH